MVASFTSPMIEILVGKEPSARKFTVHKPLVTATSEFFKRAVKEEWSETGIEPITMPEDDVSIFNLYVNMTYSGGVVATKTSASPDPDEWTRLTRLYVLAERLQDVWAKNRVVNAMHGYLNDVIARSMPFRGFDSIVELYEGTPAGSPARKLVADFYAHKSDKETMIAGRDVLPTDFVFDVACLLMTKVLIPRGFGSNPLLPQPSHHYHEIHTVAKAESENE